MLEHRCFRLFKQQRLVSIGVRCERLLGASHLPVDKTFETLDEAGLPRTVASKRHELVSGEFLERTESVLCFGLPRRGKTHGGAALGHALVRKGYSTFFTPTFRLVQELLAAKRDLALPRALQKLDACDLLILDDIGYVQQNAEEVEVLFTLNEVGDPPALPGRHS